MKRGTKACDLVNAPSVNYHGMNIVLPSRVGPDIESVNATSLALPLLRCLDYIILKLTLP